MKQKYNNKILKLIVRSTDNLVTLLIFAAVVGIVLFTGLKVYELFLGLFTHPIEEVLHTVAVIIVLVKAYRLLYFYMKSHHVSIKYIIEISIIAPAVEIIFAPGNRDITINALYGLFSLSNLFMYLYFYNQLCIMDDRCVRDEKKIENN